MRSNPTLVFFLALALSGCSTSNNSNNSNPTPTPTPTPPAAVALSGVVKDGQKPISGARVYLLAAANTGYGEASTSVLGAAATGSSDPIGAFVRSDAQGAFSIPSFTCVPNSQIYLYSLGGDAGAGPNDAASLMAALGTCPTTGSFLSTLPHVFVNEVTTVAGAFALAGFATDGTHISSSGSILAQTGLANAFLNASNLASVANGEALATIPSGAAQAPQARVNTLANILATCVGSSGLSSSACTLLFPQVLSHGINGVQPSDTMSAAINIAHNPASNVRSLYSLIAGNGPFAPALTSAPSDFVLGLNFTVVKDPGSIAIDSAGAAWITSLTGNNVTKVSSGGSIRSGTNGFAGGGLQAPSSIALDDSGNAWVTCESSGAGVVELSNSGAILSGPSGYTAGGINAPRQIAIDAVGNVWVTNQGNSIVKLSNTGVSLSGNTGFTAGGLTRPNAIAIDPSGNAWITTLSGYESIFELSNSGTFLSGPAGYQVNGVANAPAVAIDASADVWTTSLNYLALKIANSGTVQLSVSGSGTGGISVDGGGNVWVTDISGTAVRGLANSGAPISGTFGYNGGVLTNPLTLALDGSGDMWVINESSVAGLGLSELIGSAVPVVTPIASAVKHNAIGTRP